MVYELILNCLTTAHLILWCVCMVICDTDLYSLHPPPPHTHPIPTHNTHPPHAYIPAHTPIHIHIATPVNIIVCGRTTTLRRSIRESNQPFFAKFLVLIIGILNTITPQGVKMLRTLFNESVLDVLYYMSPKFGPEVIQ